jgi:hypothetical protein
MMLKALKTKQPLIQPASANVKPWSTPEHFEREAAKFRWFVRLRK